MAKKVQGRGTANSNGSNGGRKGKETKPQRQWFYIGGFIVIVAIAWRTLRKGKDRGVVEKLPTESPLQPELLMQSMTRIKEEKSVSLAEVGQQLRFFCGDELDSQGAHETIGGPPTNTAPTSVNCKTFAKSLPQVGKALNFVEFGQVVTLDRTEALYFDRRLAAFARFLVDFDALQPIVLQLTQAHQATEDHHAWPKSMPALLVQHSLHGDDQPYWERSLAAHRRAEASAALANDNVDLLALGAIACQATISDHAWHEEIEETELVDKLIVELTSTVRQPTDLSARKLLAAFGAYRALGPFVQGWSSFPAWREAYRTERQLNGPSWPLWQLWRLAVEEPLTEIRLRAGIAGDTSKIESSPVEEKVRAMYERNPYPKWSWMHGSVEWPPKLFDWLKEKQWQQPTDWPATSEQHPKVLVAGCGTGKWMTHFARHYEGHAEIWAVDLSLSSLSFTARKAEENGLKNVHLVHGDILALPAAIQNEGPFDFIESGGVLHHLRDPREGWSNLVKLLRPGGAMLVALYSRTARAKSVEPCRQFARTGGYNASSSQSLRQYRHDVFARIDRGEAWARDIAGSRDFVALNGVRDLCHHVQETQYTLLEIADMLAELKLTWLQMAETVSSDKQRKFKIFTGVEPFSADATLALWHKFEQKYPTTFAGMYEFFVRRS